MVAMSPSTRAAHKRYLAALVKRERKSVGNLSASPAQHDAALKRLRDAESELARLNAQQPEGKKGRKKKGRKKKGRRRS